MSVLSTLVPVCFTDVRRSPRYPVNVRLSGLHSRFWTLGEKKYMFLVTRVDAPIPGLSALSVVTIPTTLRCPDSRQCVMHVVND